MYIVPSRVSSLVCIMYFLIRAVALTINCRGPMDQCAIGSLYRLHLYRQILEDD